jgi:hypothetical protein
MGAVRSSKFFLIAILGIVLLAANGVPVRAQQTSGHFFPQTGHNLVGEFWDYYQSIPDAPITFGMPITEQFTSADGSGLAVQYFEKVRFELHPDQPVGRRVVLTDLGRQLYQPGAPAINTTTNGACRVVNGFGICYDFLAFYDRYGGGLIFGNPVSSFEFQPDGRVVQYFERARFEWHPELSAGSNVLLGDLGRIVFNQLEDPAWSNPALPLNNIPIQSSQPLSLRTSAFVERAVATPGDAQTIYVIVQDQALAPVRGATGRVTIYLPTGQQLVYPVITDANGIGIVRGVTFTSQPFGSRVVLDVSMNYLGLTAQTATSFRIWR